MESLPLNPSVSNCTYVAVLQYRFPSVQYWLEFEPHSESKSIVNKIP